MGQLAKYSGLTSSYIQQLEKSKRGGNMRHETLVKLAKGLRVTEDDLLNFDPINLPGPTLHRLSDGEPAISSYGASHTSSDRQLKIIQSLSKLNDQQLASLESFLDFLIQQGE